MDWKKSDVNEALATLYLRLNGYFTTGLILHSSEWGQSRTEIDCVAIRQPHHTQPERGLESSPFLQVRGGELDLIICEVKSNPKEVKFNDRIRSDYEARCALLRWAGIFDESKVPSVAERLRPLLETDIGPEEACVGILEGSCRVRPLLCCPPCPESERAGRWWLIGSELFCFAKECLSPSARRSACSTRYDFQLWGYALSPIVEYFKNRGGDSDLDDLYRHLGVS